MVRIGIVGIGGIGTVHYNNYLNIEGCMVVAAVCRSEEGRQKAKILKLTCYDDIASMINNEKIDVIDICTTTYLHREHAIESLNLGKHVIVEKPITLYKKWLKNMEGQPMVPTRYS